jgi:hypothetical protein
LVSWLPYRSCPVQSSAAARRFDTTDLVWGGAILSNVDVYRNGVLLRTVPNTGRYTDSTGQKGRATFTLQSMQHANAELLQRRDGQVWQRLTILGASREHQLLNGIHRNRIRFFF